MRTCVRRCTVVAVAGLAAGLAHAQPVGIGVVAKVGDPLGDGLTISGLGQPYTNSLGQVGFVYSRSDGIRGILVGSTTVFTSDLYLPDSVTGGEDTMGISDTGGFVYAPSWSGGDAVATQHGLLLRDDDPIPDMTGRFSTFNSRPRMTPAGTAYWVGGFTDAPGGGTQGDVLLRNASPADPGATVSVMRSGDLLDGLPIDSIEFDYDVSDNGVHIINEVLVDTGSTLNDGWLVLDGVTIVAREGGANGSGDNWDNVAGVGINNGGDYVFIGDTDGATATDGFLAYNGSIVVREGDTLAGLVLIGTPTAVSIDNNSRVAFIWNTDGGETLFLAEAPDFTGAVALLSAGSDVDADDDGIADFSLTDLNAVAIIAPGLDLADVGPIYLNVDLVPIGGEGDVESIIAVGDGGAPECAADWNGDESVNSNDISAYLTAWLDSVQNGNLIADFNGDMAVNSNDISAFLTAWLDAVQNGC